MAKIIVCKGCNEEREHYAKGLCVACYKYAWAKNNPEKVRAASRRHYYAHHDEMLNWHARYRENNCEKVKHRQRLWVKNNPEKVKAIHKRYRRRHSERLRAYKRKYARDWYGRHPERARAISRHWACNHPEKVKAMSHHYYQTHCEERKAASRRYRKKNPQKVKRILDQWRKENPGKLKEHRAWRRTREMKADGYASADQIMARIAYYGFLCYLCGDDYEHIDHVIPMAKGGSNWPANLRPICVTCNLSKGDKSLDEFIAYRELL